MEGRHKGQGVGVEEVRILFGCVLLGHSFVASPVCNQRRESELPEKDRGNEIIGKESKKRSLAKAIGKSNIYEGDEGIEDNK